MYLLWLANGTLLHYPGTPLQPGLVVGFLQQLWDLSLDEPVPLDDDNGDMRRAGRG